MQLKIVITGALALVSSVLFAQQEAGLYFMPNLWQSVRTNPAVMTDEELTVFLPGIQSTLGITGATLNDFIEGEKDGRPQINVDQAIVKLDAQNLIRNDLTIETIGVGIKKGNFYLSFGHAFRYLAYLDYPKTLPQVVWQGNAQFVGQNVALGNDLQLTGFSEFAFGASFQAGNLTLGARAKYLSGIGNISTDANHQTASLFTDPDVYQLTLRADYLLHTAGALDYENYKNLDLQFDFGKASAGLLFSKNSGYAFDLGARWTAGPLQLSASVIDLGAQINWKKDVRNYRSAGEFNYNGLDFSNALTGDSVGFGAALDTLQSIFNVTETGTAYSTPIPAKIYIGASFQLANVTLHGLFFTESYRTRTFPAFSVGAQTALGQRFTVGANYTLLPELDRYANVGVQATAKLGPFQIYATTDNLGAIFRPGNSHALSGRAGINWVIK